MRRVSKSWMLLNCFALLVGGAFSGCYRAPSAPAIQHNQADVELLRQQIQSIDWDE